MESKESSKPKVIEVKTQDGDSLSLMKVDDDCFHFCLDLRRDIVMTILDRQQVRSLRLLMQNYKELDR